MQEADVAQQLAQDLSANSGVVLTVALVVIFMMLIMAMTLIVRSFGMLEEARTIQAVSRQAMSGAASSTRVLATGYAPKAAILQQNNRRPVRNRVVKQPSRPRFSA